jgi:hypothetical protein
MPLICLQHTTSFKSIAYAIGAFANEYCTFCRSKPNYSVVVPSNFSSSVSASFLVWCITPSLWLGGE